MLKDDQTREEPALKVRAPYSKPELRVYGDVAKLTQKTGHVGMLDGNPIGSGASRSLA